MPKPAYRRAAATSSGRNRRMFALGAVIAALGAAVGFTTISNAATNDAPAGSDAGKVVNGQVILTDTCADSKLPAHDGFQKGDRCVSTEFGEVGVAANNPSLLITQAPRSVAPNTPFTLKVSTRNLIRDRFLAAGQGGYYVESSVLKNGLVRGHFHTACRMLTSTNAAPAPDPVPAFFVATEDSQGGARPDVVTIQVSGLPTAGTAQCASWAGDGSHRIPMMERANQTPALDAVRITVTGRQQGGGNNGGQQAGGQQAGNAGGNTGNAGGNTGNAGGNAGNNNGGRNNATTAPTTAPTPAATATTATGKNNLAPTVTKKATKTASPATTTTPATASGTTGKSDSSTSDSSTSDSSTSDSSTSDSAGDENATESTKAATPTTSSTASANFVYSNEDGQFNSGNKATVADQVADVQAAATKQQGGLLAFTGTNTVAAVGGAAVLLLIGMIIMAFTRRRPRGASWQ
jgi:hypothetical protein